MKQTITVELELNKTQKHGYMLMENHKSGPYNALLHFFEDIDYKVKAITVGLPVEEAVSNLLVAGGMPVACATALENAAKGVKGGRRAYQQHVKTCLHCQVA